MLRVLESVKSRVPFFFWVYNRLCLGYNVPRRWFLFRDRFFFWDTESFLVGNKVFFWMKKVFFGIQKETCCQKIQKHHIFLKKRRNQFTKQESKGKMKKATYFFQFLVFLGDFLIFLTSAQCSFFGFVCFFSCPPPDPSSPCAGIHSAGQPLRRLNFALFFVRPA